MFLSDAFAEGHGEVVQLPAEDPAAFRVALQYIYTGCCTLDAESYFSVFETARRYELRSLLAACRRALKQFVKLNPATVYASVIEMDDEESVKEAESCIDAAAKKIFSSAEFRSAVRPQDMARLLRRDTLRIGEEQIYEAVSGAIHLQVCTSGWEDVVQQVRLPLLPIGMLTTTVRENGRFSDSMILDAISCISAPTELTSVAFTMRRMDSGGELPLSVFVDSCRPRHFFGRTSDCPRDSPTPIFHDIYKQGGAFSAKHCEIRLLPGGEVWLVDLTSTGNVFVIAAGHSERVALSVPLPSSTLSSMGGLKCVRLYHGQTIRLGNNHQDAREYVVTFPEGGREDSCLPEQSRLRSASKLDIWK